MYKLDIVWCCFRRVMSRTSRAPKSKRYESNRRVEVENSSFIFKHLIFVVILRGLFKTISHGESPVQMLSQVLSKSRGNPPGGCVYFVPHTRQNVLASTIRW